MGKIKYFLSKYPLFVLLLPVFFIVHGFLEYIALSPWKEFAILLLIYWAVTIVLMALLWLFYKNISKASLAAFIIMAFIFFWGSIHDFLRGSFKTGLFIKYTFLIPFFGIVMGAFLVYLKKSVRDFSRLVLYLNCLILVLIISDIGLIVNNFKLRKNINAPTLASQFIPCDTCSKPDIYLILTDEYAGYKVLTDQFSFDNSPFENELTKRGFQVLKNTSSNYNSTVYSMAGLFNMGYIKGLNGIKFNNPDVLKCRSIIKNNNWLEFLQKMNYEIVNHSFFDLKDHPRGIKSLYFRSPKTLFNAQTFPERFLHDVAGYRLVSKKKIEKIVKWNLYNSIAVDSLIRQSALIKTNRPRFIYGHLPMPHHPYFFDRNGNETPLDQLADINKTRKERYIDYLIYTNKKLLNLIDFIQKNASRPPIIILMSDHGFRQYINKPDLSYYFMNLNAVYLPAKNYSQFYDGMTNINQFRALLNSQFGQHLPLLKDSTTFLIE